MLTPGKMGLGATLGDGRQYLSWITLPDLVRAIQFVLSESNLSGAVNAVAPEPVTNAEFTSTLAAVLHRPAFLSAPAWVLRAALGEMADEMLLTSQRARPEVLQQQHFDFDDPLLAPALKRLLQHGL